MKRRNSEEKTEKMQRVLKLHDAGMSVIEASKEVGVFPSAFYMWRKRLNAAPAKVEIYDLKRKSKKHEEDVPMIRIPVKALEALLKRLS